MDGLGVGSHGSLLEGLSQGRVSVAGASNVLARSTVLDSQGGLGDHLTGVGADDVDTEDAVGLSIGDELDLTLSLEVGLGTGVGAEGEGTDTVLDAGSLDFLLVLANPGDLGVSVHDAGDAAVVDVTVALLDVLDGSDGLLLGLVGKHGSESAVTDHADVGDLGAVLLVDDKTAALVLLDTDALEVETLGVGAATDGDEDNVSVEGLLLTTLGGLNAQSDGSTAVVTLGNLGAGLELDTLLLEDLLGLLGDVGVHAGTTDLVQELDDGDLRAEAGPNRGLLRGRKRNHEHEFSNGKIGMYSAGYTHHFQTNDTTTDDDHLLGDLLEGEGTSAGDDSLLVNVEAGERSSLRTSGNEDVLSAQGLLTTVKEVNLDGVLVNESTGTLDVVDTVLLEQELDTLSQTLNGSVLGLHHLLKVQLHITDLDTALFRVVENLVVEVGVVEQGFRGDTADVQAGTAQTATLLDTCGL